VLVFAKEVPSHLFGLLSRTVKWLLILWTEYAIPLFFCSSPHHSTPPWSPPSSPQGTGGGWCHPVSCVCVCVCVCVHVCEVCVCVCVCVWGVYARMCVWFIKGYCYKLLNNNTHQIALLLFPRRLGWLVHMAALTGSCSTHSLGTPMELPWWCVLLPTTCTGRIGGQVRGWWGRWEDGEAGERMVRQVRGWCAGKRMVRQVRGWWARPAKWLPQISTC